MPLHCHTLLCCQIYTLFESCWQLASEEPRSEVARVPIICGKHDGQAASMEQNL